MKVDKRKKREKLKKKQAALEKHSAKKETQEGKEVYQKISKRGGATSTLEAMKRYNETVENVRTND